VELENGCGRRSETLIRLSTRQCCSYAVGSRKAGDVAGIYFPLNKVIQRDTEESNNAGGCVPESQWGRENRRTGYLN
jgi:hypothetical protein